MFSSDGNDTCEDAVGIDVEAKLRHFISYVIGWISRVLI